MLFLLFDENPVLLKVVGDELMRRGDEVLRTRSAAKAREMLEEQDIDVAILDADASDNAATQLFSALRSELGLLGLPVILLSMASEEETSQRFSAFDHFSCLTKPVRVALLTKRIEALVWQDRSSVELQSASAEISPPLDTMKLGEIPPPAPSTPSRSGPRYIDDPLVDARASLKAGGATVEEFALQAARMFYPDSIELFSLMTDPSRSIADYAEVISKNPALQSAVLTRVNSVKFGVSRRVSSTPEACALMGLRDLMATCLQNTELQDSAFVSEVWHQAVVSGFIARRLSEHLCPELASEAALGGMLHTLGVVALLTVPHPAYSRVLAHQKQALEGNAPERHLADVEVEYLGFHHSELGALLVPKLGGADSVAGIVSDGTDPRSVVNAASWCAFVASLATQLRLKSLRRRIDPTADLQMLARRFPAYWKECGTHLTAFFREVESFREVFNS